MNELEKKVVSLVDEQEIVQFVQALIRARSDNPPGDTTRPAKVCMDKFSEYGIDAVLCTAPDEIKSILYPDTDNSKVQSVVATMKGEPGPTMLLNAHIDTVRAGNLEEWNYDPFEGVVENGFVYGRGAGDDKGAVLTQVMAACYIKKAGVQLKGTLQINPVADEEANATRGSKWLIDSGVLKPDILIIGEQTDNRVACGERLPVQATVVVKGKACHGAMPWNGVNATVIMAKFINKVYEELVPEVQARTNPYLPMNTISTTKIEGGIQTNIIPEKCVLKVDCRLGPEVPLDYVLSRMNQIMQKISEEGPAFEWDINTKDLVLTGNGVFTDPTHPLIKNMLDAVEEVTGQKTEPTGYMQGSDAQRFSTMNIPIAIFGPSDPSVGHSPDERVSIQQLVEGTKIMIITILRMLA